SGSTCCPKRGGSCWRWGAGPARAPSGCRPSEGARAHPRSAPSYRRPGRPRRLPWDSCGGGRRWRWRESPRRPCCSCAASSHGVVSLIPDPGGRFRAMAHLVAVRDGQGQRHILPSLPLAAVMAREGASTLRYRDGYLEIGESMRIPMEPNGYSYLQWDGAEVDRDPRGTLAREINAWRLVSNFQDLEQGNPPRHRNRLHGHSVVLTRLGTGRGVQTPVGALSSAGLVEGQAMVDL